ncbi:MAG: hypothetical protein DMG68_12545 [Acidobacteria bacterium]|nr:MAG: hypothetical protein DMG68_12545 [Acidobacteriota bacterium]
MKLPKQPSRLLVLLASHPGELINREEIVRQIWNSDTFVDFEQGLNFAIRQIRTALGDDADHPRYIETLPKRGYRFIGQPVPVAPARAAPRAHSAIPTFRRRTPVIGLVLLVATIAIVIGIRIYKASSAGRPSIRSLAVLPLDNLSADPAQQYFVDGMTDELITDLAQVRNLRVISRTSSMQYRGTKKTAPQIGRELQADALVEGTVERVGDTVRIRTQLIDAARDKHLWAKIYDRNIGNILALQMEAARDIAQAIQVQLTSQEKSNLASVRDVNPEAYEAYLMGRYFWNRRTPEAMNQARAYFERAISKDPTYAQPYAGIADSYNMLGNWGELPPAQAYTNAKLTAKKALELDPNVPEAMVAMAFANFLYDRDWSGADTGFKKAIEANPNYAPAHQWYAVYLIAKGDRKEALAEVAQAQLLDPLSLIIRSVGGWIDYLAHDYDAALEQCREAIAMDPDFYPAHLYMAQALEQKGLNPEAESEYHRALSISGGNRLALAHLGHLYGIEGKREQAERVILDMQKFPYTPAAWIAMVYSGLGSKRDAIAWLKRAYNEHDPWLVLLNREPAYDSLRSDGAFKDLVHNVGPN